MTKIAQYTAKSELDVLVWIETHSHHLTARIDNGLMLSNYHECIRIPQKIGDALWGTAIEPSRKPFDTRGYRATRKGKRMIRNSYASWYVDMMQRDFSEDKVVPYILLEAYFYPNRYARRIANHEKLMKSDFDNGFRPVDPEELKKFTEALSPNV